MTAERRRITSEMHDGLGSQLISALHLVEQTDAPKDEIAAELREALDTLRLTIDSLEPPDTDLLTLLTQAAQAWAWTSSVPTTTGSGVQGVDLGRRVGRSMDRRRRSAHQGS